MLPIGELEPIIQQRSQSQSLCLLPRAPSRTAGQHISVATMDAILRPKAYDSASLLPLAQSRIDMLLTGAHPRLAILRQVG